MKKLMNILISTSAMVFCTYSSSIAAEAPANMPISETSNMYDMEAVSTHNMMMDMLGSCIETGNGLEQSLMGYDEKCSILNTSLKSALLKKENILIPTFNRINSPQALMQFSVQNPGITALVVVGGVYLTTKAVKLLIWGFKASKNMFTRIKEGMIKGVNSTLYFK